jgi:NAD(P)-dependent dehydrogenase (short-subunit alcohol dehydrogenase family)
MSDRKGVAFITGSGRGIGKAIALKLAADGFDIALFDLPSMTEQLKNVEKEIQSLQRKSGIFVGDVSDEDSVKSVIESAVKQLGGLDVVRTPLRDLFHLES